MKRSHQKLENSLPIRVFDKCCDECLFSSKKIVSEERKKQVLEDCERQETFFICHKSSMNGDRIACHGFRKSGIACQPLQVAERLEKLGFSGLLKEVNLEEYLEKCSPSS